MEYEPRRMLVTGGLGFIFSNFIHHAVKHWPKCEFVILDIMDPSCGLEKNVQEPMQTGRVKLVKGDIRSADLVNYLLHEHNIDTVLHAAALTHVDFSLNGNSLDFTSTNVVGTHTILECTRLYNNHHKQNQSSGGVQKIIVVSTDEVIGGHDSLTPLSETASLQCTNAYSASKSAAELLCQAYEKSHKLPLIITRSGNVIGTKQALSKMIPKFISRTIEGKPIQIHGDGLQTRSFLVCDDVSNAFITIISKASVGNVYNIGTEREYTVLSVANMILQAFGNNGNNIQFVTERLFQDRRYLIDSSKLRALGWYPQQTLEDVLPTIIDWYRQHYKTWWDNINIEESLKAHPRS